jgi:hypothetical protein
MTQHEESVIKMADLIAQIEATGHYLTSNEDLAILNSLVKIHSNMSGTKPMYYTQQKPEQVKDYAD